MTNYLNEDQTFMTFLFSAFYTNYSAVGKFAHFILMVIAAGFLAVPTGLFCAVFTKELQKARMEARKLRRE